jgi:hypothetical protein
MHMQGPPPPDAFSSHILPAFQHAPPQMHTPQPVQQLRPPSVTNDIKGQDPQANDMSNSTVGCILLRSQSFLISIV